MVTNQSMTMDESITSVTVNMLAKEFVLHSDTGKELVIDCESFEQFMNVYNMIIKFKKIIMMLNIMDLRQIYSRTGKRVKCFK